MWVGVNETEKPQILLMNLYSLRYTQIHELFARKVQQLEIIKIENSRCPICLMDQKAILYSVFRNANEKWRAAKNTRKSMFCVSLIWRFLFRIDFQIDDGNENDLKECLQCHKTTSWISISIWTTSKRWLFVFDVPFVIPSTINWNTAKKMCFYYFLLLFLEKLIKCIM